MKVERGNNGNQQVETKRGYIFQRDEGQWRWLITQKKKKRLYLNHFFCDSNQNIIYLDI